MRDLAPIKERLADAREATRTGSPEARRKWEIVDTYAAHDLRDLIREAETCRASVAQLEGELRMVRATLASSREERERLQCRLATVEAFTAEWECAGPVSVKKLRAILNGGA